MSEDLVTKFRRIISIDSTILVGRWLQDDNSTPFNTREI